MRCETELAWYGIPRPVITAAVIIWRHSIGILPLLIVCSSPPLLKRLLHKCCRERVAINTSCQFTIRSDIGRVCRARGFKLGYLDWRLRKLRRLRSILILRGTSSSSMDNSRRTADMSELYYWYYEAKFSTKATVENANKLPCFNRRRRYRQFLRVAWLASKPDFYPCWATPVNCYIDTPQHSNVQHLLCHGAVTSTDWQSD